MDGKQRWRNRAVTDVELSGAMAFHGVSSSLRVVISIIEYNASSMPKSFPINILLIDHCDDVSGSVAGEEKVTCRMKLL